MNLKQRVGYILVFIVGFALCALLLTQVRLPFINGGKAAIVNVANENPETQASPEGREQIGKALAREPVVTESPAESAPNLVGTSAVANAAAKVEPAVVNIDITGVRRLGGQGGGGNPFGFFGGGGRRGQGFEQRFSGSGSGIILSADGYVVTNNHVIEPVAERGSGTITITLADNREFKSVKIVGRDPMSDLAVLKIENAKGLPAAALGDSNAIRVGDWAIAIGNPLGFNSTVTLGIVSALNRNFKSDSDALDRVIQTDAAINPGNSGGALANINGQVIGINTAIATSTGASVGIGFAIPINTAKRIIEQIVETGKVTRPYIGVQYTPLAKIMREGFQQTFPDVRLPADDDGALILPPSQGIPGVVPGSPGAKAGLQDFDVLRAVDGKKVTETNDVRANLEGKKPGDRVVLSVWRNGQTRELTVTLGTMPEQTGMRLRGPQQGGGNPVEP